MPLDSRLCFIFLVIFSNVVPAQSIDQLLEKAVGFYERDQLDSAAIYYTQLQAFQTPVVQLQALTGQIKVAIAKSEVDSASVLMQQADQIAQQPSIDLSALLQYKTAKAEYFRKNSQFETALQIHQEVVRRSDQTDSTALIHANALYYTGLTYERLGNFDSSLVYVEKAYGILSQKLDTTSLRFSNIYNGMAVCYYRANQLDEAETYYLKAKNIAENQLGPISSALAICLNNLSSIYRSKEDYQEAIRCSEQALKIFTALKDDFGKSGAYYALGVYHYYQGDYGRTKDYLEACIDIREQLFDANHYSLIGPYEVLGIIHDEAGDYEKTIFYLEKVRPKIREAYGKNSLAQGFNHENTAICFKNIGHLDSALHHIQLSNKILPKSLPKNDYALAVHYYSYADILYQQEKLIEANHYLSQSNVISEILNMQGGTEYAQNLALQGLIFSKQKKWVQADTKFSEALNIIQLVESNETDPVYQMTPNALSILNEYIGYLYRKYAYSNKAEDLALFEQYAGIYLKISDSFRRQFVDPYTKSILIKDNAEVYQRIIGIYNQLYRESGTENYLLAAYQFSEYSRASMLRDLQDEKIKTYTGIPDTVLQREKQLKKEITNLNGESLERPADSNLKSQLFEVKGQLNTLIENAKTTYPRYYDLKFRSTVPELNEVQEKLSADQNLVEYMMDDTAFYALIITPESFDLLYIGNRQKIKADILSWQSGIVSQQIGLTNTSGEQLYKTLWEPLEAKLNAPNIIIVPAGNLFYLNFEALIRNASTQDYLIYHYHFSYALSIAVLLGEKESTATDGILAVAPGFENALKEAYQKNLDSLDLLDQDYIRTLRQPWSVKLAHQIKSNFQATVLVGKQATEAQVKSELNNKKILFFGTHAIADPLEPLRSKLILSKEIGEQTEDGYLHAYELYGLPLQAELAVINACESGLGNLQQGEGMISLAYSIHYAGCPSTVMSLWKVDEKVSTQIINDFIAHLADGLTTSAALRQSKINYLTRASEQLRHPFYWSGMVLMGKDPHISLSKNQKFVYYWLLLGIALIGIGLLVWQKQKNKST